MILSQLSADTWYKDSLSGALEVNKTVIPFILCLSPKAGSFHSLLPVGYSSRNFTSFGRN